MTIGKFLPTNLFRVINRISSLTDFSHCVILSFNDISSFNDILSFCVILRIVISSFDDILSFRLYLYNLSFPLIRLYLYIWSFHDHASFNQIVLSSFDDVSSFSLAIRVFHSISFSRGLLFGYKLYTFFFKGPEKSHRVG